MDEFTLFPKRNLCACCGKEKKLKEPFHKVLGYNYMEFQLCRTCLNLVKAEKEAIKNRNLKDAKEYRTEIGVRVKTNKRTNTKEFVEWYKEYMKGNLQMILDDEIASFRATESLSDVSTFLNDPEQYLMVTYRENQIKHGNKVPYTFTIGIGGELYNSIERVCKEFRSVNCYQEAIDLYNSLINRLELFLGDNLSKEDKETVEFTLNEFKSELLDVMKERDDYLSRRNAILGKYSLLFQR